MYSNNNNNNNNNSNNNTTLNIVFLMFSKVVLTTISKRESTKGKEQILVRRSQQRLMIALCSSECMHVWMYVRTYVCTFCLVVWMNWISSRNEVKDLKDRETDRQTNVRLVFGRVGQTSFLMYRNSKNLGRGTWETLFLLFSFHFGF